MISTNKYLKIIRYFIMILLFSNVSREYNSLKISMGVFLVLFTLLITNDLIRNIIKNNNNNIWYYFSLSLSLIGAGALKYYVNGFITNIYMIYYVIEILYIKGKKKYFLLVFHCVLYLATVILSTKTLNITTRLTELGTNLLIYCSMICILYLSHTVRNEREETKKLNEELKSSNIKLQEYSLKVEELTIAKERERVAQELHDSLGHSLMALTMHLEFAEKIFDTNPEKAKEVILKARSISKDSTASLRMAVNTLKKERNIEDLSNAINEMIDSFGILGNIKIDFSLDKHLETLNPEIKLCIYKTIRESLTNGIKHGKAAAFNLEIGMHEDFVELNIKDNGLGCDTITKSNGLKGIENRVLALGGTVAFNSRENWGFLTKAEIPIYEEMKGQ
jgi:signal transduction histidine kinase